MLGPPSTNDDTGRQEMDNFDDRIPGMTFEERERSQRFLRLLMMLLMLLILMDGEQEPSRRNRPFQETVPYLRSGIKAAFLRGQLNGLWSPVSQGLFDKRRQMDRRIHDIASQHPRSTQLISINHDRDEEKLLRSYVIDVVKRSFTVDDSLVEIWKDEGTSIENNDNDEFPLAGTMKLLPDTNMVYYYPKNSSGFYRGHWRRIQKSEAYAWFGRNVTGVGDDKQVASSKQVGVTHRRPRDIGVYLIPRSTDRIYNFTAATDSLISQYGELLSEHDFSTEKSDIALNMPHGYIKIQLMSRPVPAMDELSLLDGFVKIFDGNYTTFSSAQGLLLRVRGVVIHAIGKISLVANDGLRNQSALIFYEQNNGIFQDELDDFSQRRRNLKSKLERIRSKTDQDRVQRIKGIRDDSLILFADLWNETNLGGHEWKEYDPTNNAFHDVPNRYEQTKEWFNKIVRRKGTITSLLEDTALQLDTLTYHKDISRRLESIPDEQTNSSLSERLRLHEPFVPDDDQMKTLDLHSMGRLASHEKDLFLNGVNCDFEMNFYIQEARWSVADWRRSLYMAALRIIFSSPTVEVRETEFNSTSPYWMGDFFIAHDMGKRRVGNLVMSFSGLIESPNCDFYSLVQAEALRIDWDRTAGKAVSYSFYMVLLCVVEIVLYLHQLLHSQAQSTRVSVICIAWQTIIDAMICIGHLIFSVVIQPLFTAFAMISFFKLLIFSVIEIKYMAMILHARNTSDNSAASNRRRVGWLHFSFYTSLTVGITVFIFILQRNMILALLLLYSFWLPQIFLNIFTQANKPLHRNFIFGMSLTRLFVPLYLFGMPNSYIHDIEPDFPVNGNICMALLGWVSFQVIILISQAKFGSRFMIPSFLLPPKYNYHRDLPLSLRHQNTLNQGLNGLDTDGELQTALLSDDNNRTPVHTGPRNRLKSRSKTSKDDIGEAGLGLNIDCVICYNSINVSEQKSYMLAPCDHIFHTECMSQWMNVKMECPICRMELPPA